MSRRPAPRRAARFHGGGSLTGLVCVSLSSLAALMSSDIKLDSDDDSDGDFDANDRSTSR